MESNLNGEILLCSNCFVNEGLKLDAIKLGINSEDSCPNCESLNGAKLNEDLLLELCWIFFVRGSTVKSEYGKAPIIQFNEHHHKNSYFDGFEVLEKDIELIEKSVNIGFFTYGPRLWTLGEIEPLKLLRCKSQRKTIINKILEIYPEKYLSNQDYFYRLRINPKNPSHHSEYDSAPDQFLGSNRLDSAELPVLYTSRDLELCIHECRVSAEDTIYVAKLRPLKLLKLLDLTKKIDENDVDIFESLELSVNFLFLASKHSYEICRDIAIQTYKKGFDGIIYPSYFSDIKKGIIPFESNSDIITDDDTQFIPNIALFNRPIADGKVNVESINKVLLNKVIYEVSFGPVLP